jgi:hypothetical protein
MPRRDHVAYQHALSQYRAPAPPGQGAAPTPTGWTAEEEVKNLLSEVAVLRARVNAAPTSAHRQRCANELARATERLNALGRGGEPPPQ